ncbi:MAG: hypothetical protein AAFN12_07415, partial [Cyanobacteria bacterium J06560_2]
AFRTGLNKKVKSYFPSVPIKESLKRLIQVRTFVLPYFCPKELNYPLENRSGLGSLGERKQLSLETQYKKFPSEKWNTKSSAKVGSRERIVRLRNYFLRLSRYQ